MISINMDVKNRVVLIAGGGRVALRKAQRFLEAGAIAHVVSPRLCKELAALAESGRIEWSGRRYESSDMNRVFIAVAATDDHDVNIRIVSDAKQRGILVNSADDNESGDCMLPAVLHRGDLEIAVSSNGKCPAFAVEVKNLIGGIIGDEFRHALDRIAGEREKLLTEGRSSTYNKQILRSLARNEIARLLAHKESP